MVKEDIRNYKEWPRYNAINHFYQLSDFNFVWLGNVDKQTELINLLRHSDSLGLNETDYQYPFIQSFTPGSPLFTKADSLNADIRFTDAAIHFFTDVKYGNKIPDFGYNGLNYDPLSDNNIEIELTKYLKTGALQDLLVEIQPDTREYKFVLKMLNWFQKIVVANDFKEVKITSVSVDQSNKALMVRLYQLGVADSVMKSADKKTLTKKIIEAQKLFDLLNDGVLRSTALQALNIPLKYRIQELKIALNYFRWTEQIKQTSSVLLLNIPSAYLMVYDKGKIIMDSKVVVGKASTPTPTLTSTITEVILYPYWMVPYKIATKELLPSIKRNIGFLEAGNFQVLNKQGKIVDPYKVNWQSLSSSYFPYTLRQSTGCDNSLGIVKFNFHNPFTVYLHDTPSKGLFAFNKRYFSHGCMRVENYLELAHFLLAQNRVAIDTLTAKGCLNQQAPKPIQVEKELPIMILYSTAWYNKEGGIKFYDDIYKKSNELK